jgi:hypothetical protein
LVRPSWIGVRRLDHRVALGQRLADHRVALDLGGSLLAEGVEVAFLVADLLDRQDVDVDAHLLEIDGGFVRHLLSEGLAVGVDLFDGQRSEDRSEVAFERLEDHALDLLDGHAEESLGGGAQRHVVAGDLDVGDGIDRDRHAFLGVRTLDLERDRNDVQRQVGDLLQHRDAKRGAASHDAEPHFRMRSLLVDEGLLSPVEDRDLRGGNLDVIAGEEGHRGEDADETQENRNGDPHGRETAEQLVHEEPPGAGALARSTMIESPRIAVTTTAVPGASALPSLDRAICVVRSPPCSSVTCPMPSCGMRTVTSAVLPIRLAIRTSLEACCE